jgi:hypothetical protein
MSRYRSRLRNEQGMALIGVILLLILASGVCAALAVSGKTETMAAYNLDTSAQARAAAQAGLTAALEVVITNLNTTGATPSDAINNLLEGPDNDASAVDDNGSLFSIDGTATGLPAPNATLQLAALQGVSYTVQVFDEDNPLRGITLSGAAITEIDEDGVATTDGNERVVIRATGFGRNNTTVTLEAIIGTTTLPALVTNGNLDVQGNLTLEGQNGGVHANGTLEIGSGSVDIAQDATASGTATIHASADVGGLEAGNQPTMTVPNVWAADYFSYADYILDSDGVIKNRATGMPEADQASFGWTFSGGTWDLNADPIDGTYYVRGASVRMAGSPTATMSLIVEGDIDIQGNATLTPDTQPGFDMLFVTNGDLEISGSFATPLIVEGVIMVRGQIDIAGSPDIAGQILVQDVTGAGTLTDVNEISGNPTITYNGIAGNDTFDIAGWREVK